MVGLSRGDTPWEVTDEARLHLLSVMPPVSWPWCGLEVLLKVAEDHRARQRFMSHTPWSPFNAEIAGSRDSIPGIPSFHQCRV